MIETYEVRYSDEAVNDLEEIFSYIAFSLQAPVAAELQVNRIRAEIKSLYSMPERYMLVDWEPWHSLKIHRVIVDSYIVFYHVNDCEATVDIVRIFYGGRNIEGIVKVST
jgi:toxin ParE1/3/4